MSTQEWNEKRDATARYLADSTSTVLWSWLRGYVTSDEAMQSIARAYQPVAHPYALTSGFEIAGHEGRYEG